LRHFVVAQLAIHPAPSYADLHELLALEQSASIYRAALFIKTSHQGSDGYLAVTD